VHLYRRAQVVYIEFREKKIGAKLSSWNKLKKENHSPSTGASHGRHPVSEPLAQVSFPGTTYYWQAKKVT